MKKKFITTAFFIACMALTAQKNKSVPGHLGQRNTISLGIRPVIVFSDMYFVTNLLQPMTEISYDRVMSRRSTLSISIGKQNYQIENSAASNKQGGNTLTVNYNNNDMLFSPILAPGYIKFSNTYFNVSKTYFITSRGAIAPYGKYFKMGITSYFYKVKEDSLNYSVHYNSSTQNIIITNPENDFKTKQLYAFNFELGSRTFLSKHFFFNKAIAFNLPLNFWSLSPKNYDNMSNYSESFVTRYFSAMQTLNINFALGYAF